MTSYRDQFWRYQSHMQGTATTDWAMVLQVYVVWDLFGNARKFSAGRYVGALGLSALRPYSPIRRSGELSGRLLPLAGSMGGGEASTRRVTRSLQNSRRTPARTTRGFRIATISL